MLIVPRRVAEEIARDKSNEQLAAVRARCRWDGLCGAKGCRVERHRGDGDRCPACDSDTRDRRTLGRICREVCTTCRELEQRP